MNLYCNPEEVDHVANEHEHNYWLTTDPQTRKNIVWFASLDIEVYHGQQRFGEEPWQINNVDMRNAAIYQSLYLARLGDLRKYTESARYTKSASDGVLNAQPMSENVLDPAAKHLVDMVLDRLSVRVDEFRRA